MKKVILFGVLLMMVFANMSCGQKDKETLTGSIKIILAEKKVGGGGRIITDFNGNININDKNTIQNTKYDIIVIRLNEYPKLVFTISDDVLIKYLPLSVGKKIKITCINRGSADKPDYYILSIENN